MSEPVCPIKNITPARKILHSSVYFIKSREISLGIEYHPSNNPTTGHVDQKAKHATFEYFPLPKLLNAIPESTGFMRTILQNPSTNDGIMCNFHD